MRCAFSLFFMAAAKREKFLPNAGARFSATRFSCAKPRRRFSAIPAPRARAGGAHAENLRRAAWQIHDLGWQTRVERLEAGRAEASHGVPATRTRTEFVAGGASVLASRTRRDKAKRRRLVRSLAPPKFAAPLEQRKCLSRNRRAAGVLPLRRK